MHRDIPVSRNKLLSYTDMTKCTYRNGYRVWILNFVKKTKSYHYREINYEIDKSEGMLSEFDLRLIRSKYLRDLK